MSEVPGSRWHVGNWSIVSHPPWTGVCIQRSRKGGRGRGRGEQRKGIDKDLSILSRRLRPATGAPDLWMGSRRWWTVPIGRAWYHSGARMDQSFVGLSSLDPFLSPFFLFIFLAWLLISIPRYLFFLLQLLLPFFSFDFRSCVLPSRNLLLVNYSLTIEQIGWFIVSFFFVFLIKYITNNNWTAGRYMSCINIKFKRNRNCRNKQKL